MSWNVVFCEICIFVSDPESLTEFFSPGRTKRCLRRTAQLQLNFGDYSDYNADYHHHHHHEHNTHHDDQEGWSHCNTLITSLISGALARSGGWKPERDHPSLSDLYSTKENGDNFSFNISSKVQQTNISMDRTVCTSITANHYDSTPEIQRWIFLSLSCCYPQRRSILQRMKKFCAFFYQMSIRLESLNMLLTTTLSVPFNVKELTMMLLVGYDDDDDGAIIVRSAGEDLCWPKLLMGSFPPELPLSLSLLPSWQYNGDDVITDEM